MKLNYKLKTMGLFDFIGDVAGATVKVALAPIAVVKDVASVAIGADADSTKNLIKSAGDDISDAIDEIMP